MSNRRFLTRTTLWFFCARVTPITLPVHVSGEPGSAASVHPVKSEHLQTLRQIQVKRRWCPISMFTSTHLCCWLAFISHSNQKMISLTVKQTKSETGQESFRRHLFYSSLYATRCGHSETHMRLPMKPFFHAGLHHLMPDCCCARSH